MIDAVLVFLLITALSFIGSLQPGPVNMTVLRFASDHGKRSGYLAALGGCLPEIPYSIAAIFLSDLLLRITFLEEILGYFVGMVLIILGLITMTNRQKGPKENSRHNNPFMNGLIMGILNPQLLTYWLVIYLWLQASGLFDTKYILSRSAFVAGTFSGAFLLMWVIINLASGPNGAMFLKNRPKRDLIIGSVLLLLGIWAIARNIL